MSEFCIECWNELNGTNDFEDEYVMSEERDLCEGCGQWKYVVVIKKEDDHRRPGWWGWFLE